MDPISIAQHLYKAVDYMHTACREMKENEAECQYLGRYAKNLADLVEDKFESGLPPHLCKALEDLVTVIDDITESIDRLIKLPLLARALWRRSTCKSLDQARRLLHNAVQQLQMEAVLSVAGMTHHIEEARRHDEKEAERMYKQILQRNDNILKTVQIEREQTIGIMASIQRHLQQWPQGPENQFLTHGLRALQRISGPIKPTDDEFTITPFEVIIKENKMLGQGGYAMVYEGNWQGTKVAVKVLEKGVPPVAIQKEIDVWKKLNHPNILRLFGACTVVQEPFMVCEYKSNGDIVRYLSKNPGANRPQLLYRTSLGLAYLHSHNVVHGDLKGTNILVDEHGTPCLADFGLSRIKYSTTTQNRTRTVSRHGTLHWMSPEQMASERITQKSDIYSFAMTMYEVFTGLPPFPGNVDTVILNSVYNQGQRPPRPQGPDAVLAGLDDAMWDLMVRCWDQRPELRPTAEELCRRLEALAGVFAPEPTYEMSPPPDSPPSSARSFHSLNTESSSSSAQSLLLSTPKPSRRGRLIRLSPIRTKFSSSLFPENNTTSARSCSPRTPARGRLDGVPSGSTSAHSARYPKSPKHDASSQQAQPSPAASSLKRARQNQSRRDSVDIGNRDSTKSGAPVRSSRAKQRKKRQHRRDISEDSVRRRRPIRKWDTVAFSEQISYMSALGDASSSLQRIAGVDNAYEIAASLFKGLESKRFVPGLASVDGKFQDVLQSMSSMLVRIHDFLAASEASAPEGMKASHGQLVGTRIVRRLVDCGHFCSEYMKRKTIGKFLTQFSDTARMQEFLDTFEASKKDLDDMMGAMK